METKYCSGCKEVKPLTEFYRRRDRPNGHVNKCKACRNAYHNEYVNRIRKTGHKTAQKLRDYQKSYSQTEKGKEQSRKNTQAYRARHDKAELQRRQRDTYLRSKFGITVEHEDQMKREQGYACAICKRLFDETVKHLRPCVDHCHKSQKVRGLLCNACNALLGYAQDSLVILQAAIEYLERF
jgi:Recombination endonuclease VII